MMKQKDKTAVTQVSALGPVNTVLAEGCSETGPFRVYVTTYFEVNNFANT